MALTDVEIIRLEVGLTGEASDLFSDEVIEFYFEQNGKNVKKTGRDLAIKALFVLSQHVHERSGTELEIWGHTWFENYKKALEMYLNDPNYNMSKERAMFYAGGISRADIHENMNNPDNLVIDVDVGIPTDGEAVNSNNTNRDIFNPHNYPYNKSPFSI